LIEHRIILLERDLDRVNHVESQFSQMIQDNEVSIFPAIDGQKDDLQEELNNLDIDVVPDFASRATSGQVGCAISHMKLWSELKESGINRCVVIEDDVSLTENYRHNLEVVLSELPSEWDVVLLFTHPEHSNIKNRKEIPGKMQLLTRIPTWGTVGYLISNTGVDKFLSKFSQTGIYAPIDIMIQDTLEDMKSYNLKNDLVLTVGQLTESGEDKELMKSNVWQSNTFKQSLRKMNPDQIFIANKQAEIKSQNVGVDSAEVGFSAQTEQYSTTFHLEDRAPSKGDRVSFHLSISVPSDFLDSLLLRFSIRSHYQGLEYAGRMSYSFHMNEQEIFHEKVGQFNKVNNVSLIIPKRPDSGVLELELRLDVMRDCEDWNWGPISKITVGDFSIETVENYDSYYLSTTSPYSINLMRHESSELKSLIRELASTGESVDVFIPGGNRGDGLIYQGAFKLFRQFGLEYDLLPYRYNNVIEEFVDQSIDANTLLIMGGGGFSHGFNLMAEIVPELVKKYAVVYILPTTFDITYTPVKKFLEQLPEHVSVFCREQKSHSDLSEMIPPHRLFIDHDTAFEFDYSKWMKRSQGVLNAFRDDKESSAIQLPIGNQDVSAGPDSQWKELLDIISQYSIVHTNRAHVSIAAALMGKETHIYPSSYFKQKEIFRYSLSKHNNVYFHESNNPNYSAGKSRTLQPLDDVEQNDLTFTKAIQNSIDYFRNRKGDLRSSVISILDNKLESKKYCKSIGLKISEDIGMYSDIEKIDVNELPSRFTLKPVWGHTNKGVFLLTREEEENWFDALRKRQYSWSEVCEIFSGERQEGSGSVMLEELLIENNDGFEIPFDYKIHTFFGKVKMIFQRSVNLGPNSTEWQFKFYDRDWNVLESPWNDSEVTNELPPPKRGKEMVEFAEKISSQIPIPFVRIDLYDTTEGVAFGEFTFHPGNHWMFKDKWQKSLGQAYLEAINEIENPLKMSEDLLAKIKD